MTDAGVPARERVLNVLRAILTTPPQRVMPPRQRNTLSLQALRRGIFMLRPSLRCTICGRDRIRPSTIPLWRPLQWMGLSPYRCLDCDHRVALPFRSE